MSSSEYLGRAFDLIKDSPLDIFYYIRDAVPDESSRLIYEEKCKPPDHQLIRKNLGCLAFIHGLGCDDLCRISNLSVWKIKYLTNINMPKPEIEQNIDVYDFVWLGILLTVNTNYDFERIFDEDFIEELRDYGLVGNSQET